MWAVGQNTETIKYVEQATLKVCPQNLTNSVTSDPTNFTD